MNNIKITITGILMLLAPFFTIGQDTDSVYFTNGFKMGELTDSSVVILTRLCMSPKPLPVTHQRKEAPFRSPVDFDERMDVNKMDGAVEGAFGQVRISITSVNHSIVKDWEYVSSFNDYIIKKQIIGLTPNTKYKIQLKGRKKEGAPISTIQGEFVTLPQPNEIVPVVFTSTSCQYFWDFDDPMRGFKIYDAMNKLNPSFHCQTGDYVYYDKPGPMANTVEKARHKWHANNAWPSLIDFYAVTPIYLQKDDHDMLRDDASPSIEPFGEMSFKDGLKVWYEQAPVVEEPYGTYRWGKDLQIWIVEGREYRTDNWEPDTLGKSIWGAEQKQWFTETVENSDATFKVLLSPTPVVGPDRTWKKDNHANDAFKTEGEWLRNFLARNKVYVINGDRHWQYVSVDDETGVMEFSQGPSSDSHVQGWKEGDKRPEHKYLNLQGGFVAVKVFRDNDAPVIEFMHYDVDGNIANKERISN